MWSCSSDVCCKIACQHLRAWPGMRGVWKAQLGNDIENIPANKLQALCESGYGSVVRAKRQKLCYYMSRTAKSHGAIVHCTLHCWYTQRTSKHSIGRLLALLCSLKRSLLLPIETSAKEPVHTQRNHGSLGWSSEYRKCGLKSCDAVKPSYILTSPENALLPSSDSST